MSFFPAETLGFVKADTLAFGPALIGYKYGRDGTVDYEWLKVTVLALIGLAVYQLVIRNLINTKAIQDNGIRMAFDDILKFGTMFIVLRLLSNKSFNDKTWIARVLMVLSGFLLYDLAIVNIFDTTGYSAKTQMALNNIIKFGTVFVTWNILDGGEFNKEWLLGTGGFIGGLILYDYLLSDL
jgi:hypothetical protein